MKRISCAGALVLIGVATGVWAQASPRYCYDANGDRYETYSSMCPESRPREPAKIQACTLADGSKGFGDRCPGAAVKAQQLDSTELSNRQKGLDSRTNSEKMLRYSAEEDRKYQQERWQSEYEAAVERNRRANEEQRREYEEQQKAQQQRVRKKVAR